MLADFQNSFTARFSEKSHGTVLLLYYVKCKICRFTNRLPGMGKLTYHQRLSILELDSLELRRVHAYLIFTYKLVFGLIDASLRDFFVPRFNLQIKH